MDLQTLLRQVHDDQTLLRFARALMADKTAHPADGTDWQNDTVEGFLESAIAWAETVTSGSAKACSRPIRGSSSRFSCTAARSTNDRDLLSSL
ncbi:hypothetical protein [Pseudomonas sp.]|uniref:hypothetical protein n=1 Tax=Pseudomonas sp. TaxID=306 RepID=UPI0028A59AA5|nr:hypothetical protein [Pseudomonas sp.]